MSNDDFHGRAAITRANMIDAEMAAAKADLMAHRANNDVESASASVQQIANLEAERANLTQLYQNYVASQQPARQPELTPEERDAKPWSKMDYNDVLEMCRGSKYVKDLTWNADMQAGYEETRRRKSRGE